MPSPREQGTPAAREERCPKCGTGKLLKLEGGRVHCLNIECAYDAPPPSPAPEGECSVCLKSACRCEPTCPGCGVKLEEGDLFTGGCERCSSSPVVDRDVLDRACERAHALEHIEAKERRAVADAAPLIVKAERDRISELLKSDEALEAASEALQGDTAGAACDLDAWLVIKALLVLLNSGEQHGN